MGHDHLRLASSDLETSAQIRPAVGEGVTLTGDDWESAKQSLPSEAARMEHSIGEHSTKLVLDRFCLFVGELLQPDDVGIGIVEVVHQAVGGGKTIADVVAKDASGNAFRSDL
jgi:hypothetical protein